jgi:hypothetical protein
VRHRLMARPAWPPPMMMVSVVSMVRCGLV